MKICFRTPKIDQEDFFSSYVLCFRLGRKQDREILLARSEGAKRTHSPSLLLLPLRINILSKIVSNDVTVVLITMPTE